MSEERYKGYFLGEVGQINPIDKLFAHRFESNFMRQVLGPIEGEKISYYETLFRSFLQYATDRQLKMDWMLGLHFIKWTEDFNKAGLLEQRMEDVLLRAAYFWMNATNIDLDYNHLLVTLNLGEIHTVFLASKSQHPTKLPTLKRVHLKTISVPTGIGYVRLINLSLTDCEWAML